MVRGCPPNVDAARPRRLVAAALAALSLGAAWAALGPEPAPAATPPAAGRPVWAPDRLPALLAEAQGTVELERAVDGLLAGIPSCFVVHEGARPVLVRHPSSPLTPASTQKILVGLAAVHLLGRDFRFVTTVVAGAPPRDGVAGPLWLVGAGDPFLSTPEHVAFLAGRPRTAGRPPTPLAALADGLRAAGVHTVAGGIRGDDSRYDRNRVVPSWKPGYVANNEVGPLGALIVNGGFVAFAPPVRRADDPAAHAAAELTRLAAERGITVAAQDGGTAPPGDAAVTVAEVRSAPLADVVAAMVRESDNTAAELLVRELGRRGAGDGSTQAGLAVVERELTAMGLPTGGLRLGDGSGLEVTNAATCGLLAAAVRLEGDGWRVRDWLAVAGRSGTLARRLVETPLEGRVAAKTGSLRGVTGLAGFVDGRRRLSFAFLGNGTFSETDGQVLQDRLIALAANYPGPQPIP